MTQAPIKPTRPRATPRPLPANIPSAQPGGGVCYRIELAWGRARRWWLRRFRNAYVRRMAQSMRGDLAGAPHGVIDPRDLKFCRNQCTARWSDQHDRFRWRERIPFARWGLAELQIFGWPLLAATLALLLLPGPWRFAAVAPAVGLALVIWFFRDPPRRVPTGAGQIVAPADGTVAEVTRLDDDDVVGGPAVRIGIFLSIFNVHVNRAPCEARVIQLAYRPGKFLNALNPQSAIENESMQIVLEEVAAPHRMLAVRQISGLIARRIVCVLRPGDVLARGKKFGMIKLGSRTELTLPTDGLEVAIAVGDKLKAGVSVIGRYPSDADAADHPPNSCDT